MKKRCLLLAVGLCGVSLVATAHPHRKKEPSPWDGSNLQFGFNSQTGNSDTLNVNTQANLSYEKHRWLDTSQLQYKWGKSNGDLDKDAYNISNQLDYAFDKPRKTFLFTSQTFVVDKFSAFDYQALLAVGIGHDLVRRERFTWSVQLGPGYRLNREDETKDLNQAWVATTATNVIWKITKRTKFTESLAANFSKPYNYYQTTTALTSTLFGHFAMQASFQASYYTALPKLSKNNKKYDTQTNISLIYNF